MHSAHRDREAGTPTQEIPIASLDPRLRPKVISALVVGRGLLIHEAKSDDRDTQLRAEPQAEFMTMIVDTWTGYGQRDLYTFLNERGTDGYTPQVTLDIPQYDPIKQVMHYPSGKVMTSRFTLAVPTDFIAGALERSQDQDRLRHAELLQALRATQSEHPLTAPFGTQLFGDAILSFAHRLSERADHSAPVNYINALRTLSAAARSPILRLPPAF